jgi:murein DD-endopeptidase MepM/ murein hydrolase activator NlpD
MRRLMRRRSLLVLLLLLFVPAAAGWTWPVQGPVLQTFSFDPAHPYAAGQNRGIAIGAGDGATVLAPASGIVSFAGTVPTNGKTLTIQTPSGLAVSLTHLGSIEVARNASVDEGAAVGTVGPSGTPEFDVPYVHLGIRDAANDQGYLDPLAFLPVLAPPVAAPTPAPAPAVDVPAPAPVLAAPQPVEAPATPVAAPAPVAEAPGVPVASPVPVVDAPAAQAVQAAPTVEAAAPAAHVPSLPDGPVAPMSVVAPAAAAVGTTPAHVVAALGAVPGTGTAKAPGPALPTAWLSADSLALQAFPSPDLRHGPGVSLTPRPLPAAAPMSTPGTVPPSPGFVRLLPLGLAASLMAAASIALLWFRRRPPPAPLVRLRAVHSAARGRLAA